MSLKDVRPRHVYLASAAAFVALAGFEGARMAAGHDPALAASRHVPPAATAQPYGGGGFADPNDAGPQGGFVDPNDGGGVDPGAQDGFAGPGDGGQVPQPESRLS
jgi:hypothetical protein